MVYPALGLNGEAGEVAEKVKKLFRDRDAVITNEFRESIKKELGDVLWYIANLAAEVNLSLEEIAVGNLEKLAGRVQRGTLHGDGDNR
jgi:NTP pyrophosphatase (non-canonical NTP hydrolase)